MFEVRSSNYHTMQTTLGADADKGDFVTLNEVNGFYFVGGLNGEQVTVVTKAPKVSAPMGAVTIQAGEAAYRVTATGLLSNVLTDAVLVGYFLEDRANTETEALIEFDGTLAFAKA